MVEHEVVVGRGHLDHGRVAVQQLVHVLADVRCDEPVLGAEEGDAAAHAGKDLVGLCPFHEDTDLSLIVPPVKNLWNCMGAMVWRVRVPLIRG